MSILSIVLPEDTKYWRYCSSLAFSALLARPNRTPLKPNYFKKQIVIAWCIHFLKTERDILPTPLFKPSHSGKNQARWTQVMRRHKSQFQNPLRQNYQHLKVVQDLLGIRPDQLENLAAFVGSAEPKTEMPDNVFWSRRDLSNYVASRTTVQFTENEVHDFARKLRCSALEANKETRRAHVQHVREKAIQKETDLTKCPRCGSKMIERANRKTGQSFYGCSRYPKCRGTRQVK